MTHSREYPSRPLLGVAGILFHADGSLLMVQRGQEPARGRWSIPGGLVEVGERMETAVARELHEETGLLIEPLQLVELVERIHPDPASPDRIRYHYVLADFLCRITGGSLAAASDADDVRWVPAAEWLPESSPLVEPFARPILHKAWTLWQQSGARHDTRIHLEHRTSK